MTITLRRLPYVPPPNLADEERRLEELYALKLLDTASEQRFDQYVQLAATIFDVPIALISLVDKDRQWFKSAHGVDVTELPRETSFCGHALAEKDMLIVNDATKDSRFADNPLVQGEPSIRFYAGAVLRGPGGKPVGTCCVIDSEERQFSQQQRASLQQIALMIELEMRMTQESIALRRNLQAHALLDGTTGLPNLTLFTAKSNRALTKAEAESQKFMLALVRVDKFDILEAALGRNTADRLLAELVSRIREVVPASCLIGQAREDKLSVLLNLCDGTQPTKVLNGLLACLDEPIWLDDHAVSIQISIGASVYPRDGKNIQQLLNRARTALWSRAVSELSGFSLYRRRDSSLASRHLRLESALRHGLQQGEFCLFFQPKVDVTHRRLVGAEALIRWTSAKLGTVPPSEFIPLAEKSGLIVELGSWVLSAACKQMAAWVAKGYNCPEIAVNISSLQLRQRDFCELVQRLLRDYGLAGGQLNLEVTEGSLVEDIQGAVNIMTDLRQLGVTFSIDDFGTGFSSLSYLRKMPIKVLKIDRSFVMNIPASKEDSKLVRSIVSMAQDLELQVVAEGVETDDQLAFLQSIGCDQVQGYVIDRPLAPEQFVKYLDNTVAASVCSSRANRRGLSPKVIEAPGNNLQSSQGHST